MEFGLRSLSAAKAAHLSRIVNVTPAAVVPGLGQCLHRHEVWMRLQKV
jgi:hypothetical protein